MPHAAGLLPTLAASLSLALLFGFLAERLRLPALSGYLLAGVLLAPTTPGYAADLSLSSELAEIGVILLMFGVGLRFSIQEIIAVRRIAVPGALIQIAAATALTAAVARAWGWAWGAGVVLGLALSVASTVVLLRALEEGGALRSVNGQIALGWLVVEDIVTVLVLVALPGAAGWLAGGAGQPLGATLWAVGLTLLKAAAFVVLMLVAGKRVLPWLLWRVGRTGSRELFMLGVIAPAVGIAYAAARLFGVSFALGAFFAGTVLSESKLSHRAAEESLPLRDAFSVLFFVSVGMLFDPRMVLSHPFHVLAVVAIVMLGKAVAAFLTVALFRYPVSTALLISASLAQIGEFSFILAGLGVSLKILPVEARSLVVAGALISIPLNHFLFRAVEPAARWVRARSRLARMLEATADPLAMLPASVPSRELTGHVVIVGYGRVGGRVGEALLKAGRPIVVAEENRELVEELRARGVRAVAGDGADEAVLIQAHIARASALVIAVADAARARRMSETARLLNPRARVVVRAKTSEDSRLLEREAVGRVLLAEEELAASMVRALEA